MTLTRTAAVAAPAISGSTWLAGCVTVTLAAGATQVAAGMLSSYAVHTVLVLAGQSS